MTGIYIIINKKNDHSYIGQSVNIYARWADHRTLSKRNKGYVLGCALTKYGHESFDFLVLEECFAQDLDERERFYIQLLKPTYNMNNGGEGNGGRFLSEKAKKILSDKAKKNWHSWSDEKKKYILSKLTGPKKNHIVRPETRKKIKKSALKQFENGMPEKTRRKISKAHKGKPKNYASRQRKVEQVDPDALITIRTFDYVKDAAKYINRSSSGIQAVLHGRQNVSGGYAWKYCDSCSVETIPKGSRTDNKLPSEAQSNSYTS